MLPRLRVRLQLQAATDHRSPARLPLLALAPSTRPGPPRRVPLLRKPGSDPLCVNCTTTPDGDTPTDNSSPEQHQAPKRRKETAAGSAAASPAPAASRPAAVVDGSASPAAAAAAASSELEAEEGLLEAPPSLSSLLRKAVASPAAPATTAGGPSPGEISAWRPPPSQAAAAAATAPPGSNGGVDVSQLLADKLLQGWALLEQHCPRCGETTTLFAQNVGCRGKPTSTGRLLLLLLVLLLHLQPSPRGIFYQQAINRVINRLQPPCWL